MKTYADNGVDTVALVNEKLQRIVLMPASSLPLINDAFENLVQLTTAIYALDHCGRGQPGKCNRDRSCALLNHLKQVKAFVEQWSVIRDLVAADGTHVQLEDGPVDDGEGVNYT